jgi:signal transduction histidine kinase
MTRPIVDLTKGAQRLAHGDFSTEFDGRGFTETEQLATTLNYAAQELRTLDSDRKELLANVSHDLKTPLTIIKIYAETIRDVTGGDATKRQAHCETIIEEANRLTDMVNEIVEISRLESGAASVVMGEVDLAACLQETMTSFNILVESEGYTFDLETVDEAPITGNEHYMRRALYNLIGNAINYTGEDRYVGIRLTRTATHVRFEVADHGPGIATDKIATIWDRYYKSRSSHKRAVIGSGIGLSIVRHILTLHGATFGVTSAPGTGSRFWFEVPRAATTGSSGAD